MSEVMERQPRSKRESKNEFKSGNVVLANLISLINDAEKEAKKFKKTHSDPKIIYDVVIGGVSVGMTFYKPEAQAWIAASTYNGSKFIFEVPYNRI